MNEQLPAGKPDKNLISADDPAPRVFSRNEQARVVANHLLEGGSVSRLDCERLDIEHNSSIHSAVSTIQNRALVPVTGTRELTGVSRYRISAEERARYFHKRGRKAQIHEAKHSIITRRVRRCIQQTLNLVATLAANPALNAIDNGLPARLLCSLAVEIERELGAFAKRGRQ
jgi:hypothetical protein